MHAINLKNVMRKFFYFAQINGIIRFNPNFFLSSQRGSISVVCGEGTVNQ